MEKLSIKNILVPTDLSESNVAALRYARLLADRFNASLTVMHADTTLRGVPGADDRPGGSARGENVQRSGRARGARSLARWMWHRQKCLCHTLPN